MRKLVILLLLILTYKGIAKENEKEELEATTALSTERSLNSDESFTKCYNELGCVHVDESWFDKKIRPINLKPMDREIIKTQFVLIRKNRTSASNNDIFYQVFTTSDESLKSAGYKNGIFLFMLIHDFTCNGYSGWIKHITRVLKNRTKQCNVISVDWQGGAEPIYDQAIANARVVAMEIILMLTFLKEKNELTFTQVHLIGHGVGAHIAGYVGQSLKPHKISGLDPSGPRFQGMPRHVRLDAADAEYVEVLHTDAMDYNSQGSTENFGHTDFFINDAELQPGCPKDQNKYDLISVTRTMLNEGDVLPGCSHKRAYKYFIESLEEKEECTFLGIKCDNYLAFRQGKCTTCGHNCRTFGLITYSELINGSYYLQTDAKPPYCLYQYRVTIEISGEKASYFGSFEFILIDKNHFTTTSSMLEPREFQSGANNSFVFYAGVPEMSRIVRAKVGWREKTKIFCIINCKQATHVQKISIQSINSNTKNKQEVSLCPKENYTEIQNGDFQEFIPCTKTKEQNKE